MFRGRGAPLSFSSDGKLCVLKRAHAKEMLAKSILKAVRKAQLCSLRPGKESPRGSRRKEFSIVMEKLG
jgi:hypothetical protein